MRVHDLSGIKLDWAVTKSGGGKHNITAFIDGYVNFAMFHYSSDWREGGPIIEREGIEILCNLSSSEATRFKGGEPSWFACSHRKKHNHFYGQTPLQAAMKCYCFMYLGENIEIPDKIMSFY